MAYSDIAKGWIWRDGTFVRWEDATIHVMSHVVHYGSSVFEGIRCYDTPEGPEIFRLDDHLRRLVESAKIYRMEIPYSVAEMREVSHELLRRNGLREGYIRPIVIRGAGAVGVNPAGSPIETFFLCWPWGAYLGAEALEKGVDACVSTWFRPSPNTFPSLAKAGGNYLNSQLVKMEAVANGYHEGIAVGPEGLLSEGSGQNVFLVKRGVLYTPVLDGTMLGGITRNTVLHLARERGIETVEGPIPREMLYTSDEVFFAGTAAEVTPVRTVDRIQVGEGRPGPVTVQLQTAYLDLVKGKSEDPHGWRDVVAWEGAAVSD
ncbi:MAG: branched-chain amino acid transaminase [Gemmatimonadetes bacterium]|nr:branched-chain amino acid transaminase [Gemmatimonadota bacterium]